MTDRAAAGAETSATTSRKPGRPRRASTGESIIRATLELLRDGGVDVVSIDAIAAKSGVAKTTIYRRWPSLDSLIVDALRVALSARADQVEEIQEFDAAAGSAIRGAARQVLALVNEPMFHAAFPMMARILLGDRALGDRFRAAVFAPLRAIRRDELSAMVARGELRPGTDPDLLLDIVNGTMIYRALMGAPLDEHVADEIAGVISRSFGVEPPAPEGQS